MLRKSDKEKKEILFGDFVFHDGENVTIRRGVKWYNVKGMFTARPSDPNDENTMQIDVVHTEIYKFADLPARVVDEEHIPDCRIYSNLLKAMRTAYGDDFKTEEYVTVIYFYVR